jgi:uncharacterized Zn finger protein (UPF0148 family)
MERLPHTRQSAVACPSCGARRIISGTVYCDQCGKRIPDSLIEKLQKEKIAEAQGRAAIPEIPRPPEPLDRADQSGPSPSLSDNTAKSQTGTIAPGREMPHMDVQPAATALWTQQRILGASLVAFGVVTAAASMLVGALNLGGLGLASFLIGLLLVYLNSGPSFAPELVEASVLSSLANVERVLRELGPDTKAVYLKMRDRLDVPMVFIPLEENPAPSSELSLADEDRFLIMDPDDPHKTGLLFEAPGGSLLTLMEKESGVNFIDLTQEDFLDPLRSGLLESLEVATDLKAIIAPEGVKFRIKDGALRGLSQSVAKSAPNVASRLGCPICSAAICATVKAVKSDMILEEAAHHRGSHAVTLKFARGAANEAR